MCNNMKQQHPLEELCDSSKETLEIAARVVIITGQMPSLLPNQQWQHNEGNISIFLTKHKWLAR